MSAPPTVDYFTGMFANEPLGEYNIFAAFHELEATCHHEASHAVVDYLFGRSLSFVGIKTTYQVGNGGEETVAFGGEVNVRGPSRIRINFDYRWSHLALGCALAAGPAGERRYRHEVQLPMRLLGASEGDHQSLSGIGKSLALRGRRYYAYQRMVWHLAQRIIADDSVWAAISDVAQELFNEAICVDDEPGEHWSNIEPRAVYAICRWNGLRQGMARDYRKKQ